MAKTRQPPGFCLLEFDAIVLKVEVVGDAGLEPATSAV